MNKELANLLFPNIKKTPNDYLKQYPPRKNPALRLAPSPTGHLHIGSLGMALACRMLANNMAPKGKVFLRIEDTDKKREVEGAVEKMLSVFARYNTHIFDEGAGQKGKGQYAPYVQSERIEIYHSFAKALIENGHAYPCFCTGEDLEKMREKQTQIKTFTGYYGKYTKCDMLDLEEVKKNLEKGIPWVLRFRPQPDLEVIKWNDLVRGESTLPAIINNPVIIKSSGLPPYNLGHVVDDLLMRTSHVIRGEEWLPSTAEHIQLAQAVQQSMVTASKSAAPPYQYAHLPVISVEEDGRKRKLSKRKDKNALAETFLDLGYPPEAVLEYLLTLYNTDFELWRIANPDEPFTNFTFRFEKIGKNSPLFDEAKLDYISRNIIAKKTCVQINKEVEEYFTNSCRGAHPPPVDKRLFQILAVDRETEKPRKDIAKYSDILTEFDYLWTRPSTIISPICAQYAKIYNHSDTKEQWFNRIKTECAHLGSAKEITQAIRLALTGREKTTDLYTIMQALGEEQVKNRLHGV